MAVIECVPTERLLIGNVATPLPFMADVPMVVAPSLNVTDPVGVPAPVTTVTVAVKVVDCPYVEGFTEEVRAVAVVAWLMTCESGVELEREKFVSPL